jgi:hypothetical protein
MEPISTKKLPPLRIYNIFRAVSLTVPSAYHTRMLTSSTSHIRVKCFQTHTDSSLHTLKSFFTSEKSVEKLKITTVHCLQQPSEEKFAPWDLQITSSKCAYKWSKVEAHSTAAFHNEPS